MGKDCLLNKSWVPEQQKPEAVYLLGFHWQWHCKEVCCCSLGQNLLAALLCLQAHT